jgi:hypothetical protein
MTIRWERGLFRLWAVFAALWVGFGSLIFWLDRKGGICGYSDVTMPRIPPWECAGVSIGISERDVAWAVVIFGLPVLMLIIGFALVWAIQGFRPKKN